MTITEQIKALAELDGWLDVKEYTYKYDYAGNSGKFKQWQGRELLLLQTLKPLKPYHTSYDAIITLRKKVLNSHELKVKWLNYARTIVSRRVGKLVSDFNIACIEPDEDGEAILRATGKWKNE